MKNAHVMLTFYHPPANDNFMNRLVAWFDGPFSHVEICFSDGTSSSIFAGETVFVQQRRFSNPNYQMVSIPVTELQAQRARAFCCTQAARRVGFDNVGMYLSALALDSGSFSPCARSKNNNANRNSNGNPNLGGALAPSGTVPTTGATTYCSKHVVHALQYAGVEGFEDLDPSRTTPSALFRAVRRLYEGSVIMASTGYRLEMMYSRPNPMIGSAQSSRSASAAGLSALRA
jgi:hypothetical protein